MFLCVLTDVHPEASRMTVAVGSMKVVVPAKTILSELPAKQGSTSVTLRYVSNTGNLQIMTSAALEDDIKKTLVKLEKDYADWQRAPADAKPVVEVISPAVFYFHTSTLGLGIKEPMSEDENIDIGKQRTRIPTSESYVAAMNAIVENVELSLTEYPDVRRKLLNVIRKQFLAEAKQQSVQSVLQRRQVCRQHTAQQQPSQHLAFPQQTLLNLVEQQHIRHMSDHGCSASRIAAPCREYEDWTIG